MNPKVSILVTVFKTEKFIEKCAKSIFNQTFEDIEYIFINDGTPDNSISILQNTIALYPEKRNNIKIIHHNTNRGSAAAKNTAIDVATGDYILFVDSDDYIDQHMIETLYNKAIVKKADVVVSDMIMEYSDRSEIVIDFLSEDAAEHFSNIIKNEESHSFLCNKLVHRSLYCHPECRVPEGLNYYEDRHIMSRIFYFAKKIVKVNQAFYHYVHYNTMAITKTKDRMHFENVVLFWKLFDEFLYEHNEYEKYKEMLAFPKMQSKVRLMIDTHSSELRKEYASIFLEEEKKCFDRFNNGEKLMLLLVRYKLFGFAQLFHNYLVAKHINV
jgi:glycosyltransferase involved in cell wall biosynthesis